MSLPDGMEYLHDCTLMSAALSFEDGIREWTFVVRCPEDLDVGDWNGRLLAIVCSDVACFVFDGTPVAGTDSINFCSDRPSDRMRSLCQGAELRALVPLVIMFHSGSSFECVCEQVSVQVVS